MKIVSIILLAFLSIVTSVKAQQTRPKTDTVFFEDFNGQTLDRAKWNVEVTGNTVNDEQEAYVDSTSTLYLVHGAEAGGANNGALVIKAVYHPGYTSKENKKYDFLSGRINTQHKLEFKYGTASARMKMEAGAGLWPAFWALGNGNWPACGELTSWKRSAIPAGSVTRCMGPVTLATRLWLTGLSFRQV